MKDRQLIQQEVDKTLSSIDNAQRAHANPFLFTRIKAALRKEERSAWSQVIGFMARPVVAFATVFLVLLINFAVFFTSRQTSGDEEQQLYANEYFSNTTISDFDNVINE